MLNTILFVVGGIVLGYIVPKLFSWIAKQKAKQVQLSGTPNLYAWDMKKFILGMTDIFNPKKWGEDLHSIFNLRKLIIYGLVIGAIFGYGYWKGQQGKPVQFDFRGKEATIRLNEHFLRIEKDGTAKVIDKDGKVLKTIRVKDIPELERQLRPIGLILEPIAVVGGSLGTGGAKFEAGAGISFFKYYKFKLDAFLTNIGAYLGTSYQITDNSGVGIGIGKGYSQGDTRIIGYYKFKF